MANMDDMDPSLAAADLVRDGAQFAYLQALGDAIYNKEFAVHLAAHGARDGASSSSNSARTTRKRHDQALKRFMERAKRTATTSAARAAAPKRTDPIAAWNRWQAWNSDDAEAEVPDSPTLMDLPAWRSQRKEHDSDFTGAGYHTSISSRAASRHWERWNASGKDKAGVLTNKQRRKAMRSLRDFHEASGAGEDLYMAFNTFDSSRTRKALKKFASMDKKQLGEDEEEIRATMPKSKVFSKDEFTIVDSGTTVSIEPGKRNLSNFDELKFVKIMGFNGATSRSTGSGNIFGFALSPDGQRSVPIRMPRVHHVPGAPHGLLSVSTMIAIGYEFHFTKERSFIVTPSGEELDLIQKAGLFWLRWRRSSGGSPHTTRRDSTSPSPLPPQADAAAHLTTSDAPTKDDISTLVVPESCSNESCECCFAGRVRGHGVPLSLLHQRLGHWNEDMIEKMVKHRAVDYSLTDRARCVCEVCRTAKATRKHVPVKREDLPDQTKLFQRIWTDLKGKVCRDFWGNQYIVTFTCEVSRWSIPYFAKSKSDVKKCYSDFLKDVELMGHKVEVLNSDGGGEYTAGENAKVISDFQKISSEHGITQNFTAPYTPEMNGVSERLNRTIVEHTRAILIAAGLAKEFWSMAAKHVVYLRNRLWHRALQTSLNVGASPYQMVFGKAPKLINARVWGCDAWKLDHLHKSSSFTRKAKKMIFVGLSANRKGWVLFDPATRRTSTTYHCTFNEDMSNRVCALRDFDQRQRKAGPGASADDERLAVLERSLYDANADLDIEEKQEEAHKDPSDLGESPSTIRQATEESQSPSDLGESPSTTRQATRDSDADDSDDSDTLTDEVPRGGARALPSRTRPDPRSGGRSRTRSADQMVIPERRAAIGAPQDLDDEEKDFLKIAFELKLPMVMQQRNPKTQRSTSRARYEKYKSAKTLWEAKELGAEWKDIVWDYERGYIDFSPSAASNANLAELINTWEQRGIASSPAAYVDNFGIVNTSNPLNGMSLEESIQQEYAQIAFEHIEDMPHRAQRLLQRALGNETLERFAHSCAARIMIPEPLSVKEAMASEHAAEWRAAMQEEIDTLTKFGCFERVSRSEAIKHGKLTRAKWVFKVKYESTGELQRFKCRLVAKGFTQVEGNDFYETFSPVFGYSSLRAIMADAAARDFQLNQWDLKSSFIQQDLDVDHMYMEVPDGFDKYLPNGQPAALHMLKSIYGLKQSSRLLHERMSKYLVKLGFRQLISDQCVFVKGEGDEQVIVCTWVDDIIMSSARHNVKAREEFDRALRDEFVMSPWTTGECDWVLNMTVKRDYKEGILHLSQPLAIEKLAEKFKLTGREGYAPHVPMAPNLKLIKPADEDIVPYSTWDYRSAVGGLLYLSLTTRPDVAQAVGVLSRFMSYPGQEHVDAAKQVIRYLYGTKEYGIEYRRDKGNAPHQDHAPRLTAYTHTRKSDIAREDSPSDSHLIGTYCDADYAGDAGTRKSTGGYGILMAGGLICWSSKLQPTVALSTAEAETMAGLEAVKQLMHLRLFLKELGNEQHGPSVVFEDNNAAISIAHGKEQSKRSKHYQIKVHFLNEAYKSGIFAYEKVPTKEMLADAFTKSLPREDFSKYRGWMGVNPPPTSEV